MRFRKAAGLQILVMSLLAMHLAVSAGTERDRETKMKLYEIMYGDEEPEDIQPALAPEEGVGISESISEGEYPAGEAVTEAGGAGNETDANGADETDTWYPDFTEEKMYLPEAIARIEEMESQDEEVQEFVALLRQMIPCQGTYFETSSSDSGDRVYTAEVEIFLKYGVPTCIIDYEGYVGFLEEAQVKASTAEGYTLETWPIGKMAGYGQEFYIAFDEEHMHIVWAEGGIEKDLKKSSGAAEELEDNMKPFAQTELYQTLVDKIDEAMGNMEHSIAYDEDTRTLSVYIVMNKNGRQKALNNASAIKENWDAVLDSLKPMSEELATALTMATRDGLYDFMDAHCILMVVDELNDRNIYYPQDVWTMIQDGTVGYDFLKESGAGADSDWWQTLSQTETESTGQGSSSYTEKLVDEYLENTGGTGSYSASSGERNAVQKAKEYLDFMHFSYEGLVEQLEFEGFTHSDAVYGAEHCGADWYEQAVGKAREYLDFMSFSYDGLVEQLEYEGFTHDQAVHGANVAY